VRVCRALRAHHSTDGNTDLHHVVIGDESVTFDDGSFERSSPRSPIDHVDSSERATTTSDDGVSRDSRSESAEDDDTSISAIRYNVTLRNRAISAQSFSTKGEDRDRTYGDSRSSASHRDTIGPFSRSDVGRPIGSVSLELVTVIGSVTRGTDLVVLDDHSAARVLVTFNTMNDGPSTGFVKVRVLNSLRNSRKFVNSPSDNSEDSRESKLT